MGKEETRPVRSVPWERPAGYGAWAALTAVTGSGQKAFTQGKVKIGGKMLTMMQLRGPLAQVQTALPGIDTEY